MEMDSTLSTKENIAKEKKKNVGIYIDDKTLLKVGSEYVWIWVAIEPLAKVILGISISLKEQCLLLKDFLRI
jgi:putative transposase